MDVTSAERELDSFIERRARQGEDDRRTEVAWAESVRIYNTRRQEERRALWLEHHLKMQAVHEGLAENHRERASALGDGS